MAETKKLKVTQVGSPQRRPKDQRQTMVGLGLKKMHSSRVLDDTCLLYTSDAADDP